MLRGKCRKFTKTGQFARGMRHHAIADDDVRHRQLPLQCCRLRQHGTRTGACFAHRQPQVFDAGRATGHHQTEFAHGLARQKLRRVFESTLVVGVKRQAIDSNGLVVIDVVHRCLLDLYLVP